MQLTEELGIDRVEPDLKIQVMRTYFDRQYTSRAGEHIRFVIGQFKQQAAEHKRRHFRGAILVVTDKDGEREAVECFGQPNVVRQARLRRRWLRDLARAKATSDEFCEAVYEMAETTLPLEEGMGDYTADDEDESPRRVRIDDVREKF